MAADRVPRLDAPASRTYALGLIGADISGSLSPSLHEAEARAQGFGLTYRILDLHQMGISVAQLPELLAWLQRLGFDGVNVTHPCKQAIIPLLDETGQDAIDIHAVNTVVFQDGRAIGHNTDASGFIRALREHIQDAELGRIVLLGAGGAGSAIAHALLSAGAQHLTVVDVNAARRIDLSRQLQARFGADRVEESDDPSGALRGASGLVHATPTGMKEHPGLPLPARCVRPDLWVADIVYFPIETELIRLARSRGCQVMDGGGMAVYQAVAAFEYFTGRVADAQRMSRHFESMTLGSRQSD